MFGISWPQWALILATVLYAVYRYGTSTFGFFKDKGVIFLKPMPFLGNFHSFIFKTKTFHDVVIDMYAQFKDEKYFGIFFFRSPLLVIRDPNLIKQLAVKDFDHFSNHRDFLFTEVEPLMGKSLFMMRDQKWRDMRATLSPAFTGSKMRLMFQLIEQSAEDAVKVLLEEARLKKSQDNVNFEPELKDIFTRCMTDVIATTAFGIQVNSLHDRENAFYKRGSKSVKFGIFDLARGLLISKFPRFSKWLNIKFFDDEHVQFYRSLVLDTMKHRTAHGIVRPDMIQLLMESKKGSLKLDESETAIGTGDGFATVAESMENRRLGNSKRVWTDDDYTSQCFLFFLAGFETSSTLMCLAVHELAVNKDVQMRLVKEIDEVRQQLNGKPLSYEVLQKMPYLDMVVSETLRKWPPAVATDRACTKPYQLVNDSNGQKINFNRGDGIWIPILGLHRDPNYFPNPDLFDPERFSVENRNNIRPFTYIPFGVGPRNCIASRFALMETKAFLFTLLSSFIVNATPKTQIPLKLVQNGFGIVAEKGFNVHLEPREIVV